MTEIIIKEKYYKDKLFMEKPQIGFYCKNYENKYDCDSGFPVFYGVHFVN